jgi:hypothetical protein
MLNNKMVFDAPVAQLNAAVMIDADNTVRLHALRYMYAAYSLAHCFFLALDNEMS